jgi:hypothetical protein
MSSGFAHEFEFTSGFDETIFQQCPYATPTLKTQVQNAVEVQQRFLQRFSQVKRIAQQVQEDGRLFRIILSKA